MNADRDRGQSTVELALVTPLVCLLLLAVVQLAVIVRDRLAVADAARVGARAASVAPDPAGAGTAAALTALSDAVPPGRASVVVGPALVTVTVAVVDDTNVPIIGWLLPPVEVSASATMLLEPP